VLAPSFLARAPAKVNLTLRVLGKRADGYHELDTIFQAIDLWDRLEIAPGEGLSIRCSDPEVPTDGTNLVLRASKLLLDRHAPRRRRGAAFRLAKSIPARGGLGGGSADAAAALLLGARFWDLQLEQRDLMPLAEELGADVPFFLCGGTARGTGRGDRIEPLPFAGTLAILLGIAPFGISTAEVFGRHTPRLTLPGNGVNLQIPSAHKLPIGKDFRLAANDLEGVVFRGWPELRRFRDALLAEGAEWARLSGSGSTVYGVFAEESRSREVASRLGVDFEGWKLVPTRAVEEAVQLVPPSGDKVRRS
jgi:4-diphosphocytidyl-2-C-methyl-D-erythritol kinase